MQTSEVILKHCPFCGGQAKFVILDRSCYRHAVQCVKCEATTGGSAYKNDSYNADTWNRRS